MGLAKSLSQSCPYGSVHVAGAPVCRQVVPEHRLMVLCQPPFLLGLGFHFFFIHFSSLGEYLGAAGISRASRTFNLSGGCPQKPP